MGAPGGLLVAHPGCDILMWGIRRHLRPERLSNAGAGSFEELPIKGFHSLARIVYSNTPEPCHATLVSTNEVQDSYIIGSTAHMLVNFQLRECFPVQS
jgi:hypothetical protein